MKIPVFYSPKQVALDNVSASPSAQKPQLVVESWEGKQFPIEIHDPMPVSEAEFGLAHDAEHVREVLGCITPNGFSNRLRSVAESLPWTSGSMLSAAKYVLEKNQPVAVSPTSGFHHAGWDTCEGFCTFNGLMVTIRALREAGFHQPIGILDLDEHYGNGTDDILRRLGDLNVVHYSYGKEPLVRGQGDKWLDKLPEILESFRFCGLVLYQAGADPHWDDPYGRGVLTDQMLLERDLIVFQALRRMGIPVVWNLAGGYQTPVRKVLDIHDSTMWACIRAYLETP